MQLINFNNSFRYQHEPGLNMRAQSAIMDVALDPAVPICSVVSRPVRMGLGTRRYVHIREGPLQNTLISSSAVMKTV